jgi:hypothetical protein
MVLRPIPDWLAVRIVRGSARHQASRPNKRSDATESLGVLYSSTADKADGRATLVGQDSPAIHLLLVHPAVSVKGFGNLGGDHVLVGFS